MTLVPNGIIFLGCFLAGGVFAQTNVASESPVQRNARMEWWREARFGMFIHWGLYSVAGGNWHGMQAPRGAEWIQDNLQIPASQYASLVPRFNPTNFDARAWARLAKNSGMKYLVITAKHHEGFCMFPTGLTDWSIASTPFHRDPLMELSQACKAEGLKFGIYYSILDWHHPNWGNRPSFNDTAKDKPDMDRYVVYMKAELKEIIGRYHPAILWFDGAAVPWTRARAMDLEKFLRVLDPMIIINDRIGAGGDFGTPEQTVPKTPPGLGVDWESCMTMNISWGYKANDHFWQPAKLLIRTLVAIASEGGNYLLNVGPTGDGVIPAESVVRLEEMGRWLKVNGESIYGTHASPFHYPLYFGSCTSKADHSDTILYLHVFWWPQEGKIVVPGVKNRVLSAELWTDKKKISLPATRDGSDVVIPLPAIAPDTTSSTIALRIEGAPDIHDPPPATESDRAVRRFDDLQP